MRPLASAANDGFGPELPTCAVQQSRRPSEVHQTNEFVTPAAINIQFTSGTTGAPKAATLTHHGLLNNGYFCGLLLGIEAGERLGQPFPLYHVGGMVCGSILGITLGATTLASHSIQLRRLKPFRRSGARIFAVSQRC